MSQNMGKENWNKEWFKDHGFNSQYEYQCHWAREKYGVKNYYEYQVKILGLKQSEEEFRYKTVYEEPDPQITPIPNYPGYYATPSGKIWCYSERRKGWIMIAQQAHKSGYLACQPYVDGKRKVKYVHRLVCSAFEGDRDASVWECHHIDGDRHNNHIVNLQWMEKYEHRAMPRGKYKKRGR